MRRFLRLPVLVIVGSLLVIVGAAAGYALAGSHQVWPGVRGCELVRDVSAQTACVERLLMSTMRDAPNATDGLRSVDRLAGRSSLVQRQCHLAMHGVGEHFGQEAARRGAFPPPAGGSTPCRMGYLHGMMLGFVGHSDSRAVAEAMPDLCQRDSLDEGNCAHALGHLIVRTAGLAQAERRISEACDPTTVAADTGAAPAAVTEADAAECVRGGYMEIAMEAHQPPLATWRDRCVHAPHQNRPACFAWLPPIAEYRKLPRSAAAAQCETGAGTRWHEDCIRGIARSVG